MSGALTSQQKCFPFQCWFAWATAAKVLRGVLAKCSIHTALPGTPARPSALLGNKT